MTSNRAKIIAAVLVGTSPESVQFLIDQEGWVNKVYRDSVGLPTVCVGHMDRSLIIDDRNRAEVCIDHTAKLRQTFIRVIDSNVIVLISDEMITAVISLVYNIGAAAFRHSTLLEKLNRGD